MPPQVKTLDESFHDLLESGVSPDQLYDAGKIFHHAAVFFKHLFCDCMLLESGVSPDQLYDAGKCCC